jgi:large subunit ribosomal protein L4
MQANRRSGTANTKTRGEVKCSGKKPWRQKGTGRARSGGNASPVWEGGGVVFGPRPRDYSKKVNKATRRLAFAKALSERIKDGDVLVIDSFAVSDGKTRSFAKEVSGLTDAKKVIIVGNDFDETTKRAARNYQPALLMSAAELNTEHVLLYGKIVVVKDALCHPCRPHRRQLNQDFFPTEQP